MKECRILKREQAEKKGKAKEKGDEETTAVTATHDDMFVLCDDGQVNIIHYDSDWVVDSGASYHVTPHRHFFSIYTEEVLDMLGWEMRSHAKLLA